MACNQRSGQTLGVIHERCSTPDSSQPAMADMSSIKSAKPKQIQTTCAKVYWFILIPRCLNDKYFKGIA